jgi:molybdate transport system regulatory protein
VNRIKATVNQVTTSGGIKLVDLEAAGCKLTALLIDSAPDVEWLKVGVPVYAVFKETEVSLGKNLTGLLSLRNKLPCTVSGLEKGTLMSVVHLQFGSYRLGSAITTRSVEMLGLQPGDAVTALIKSNEMTLMKIPPEDGS